MADLMDLALAKRAERRRDSAAALANYNFGDDDNADAQAQKKQAFSEYPEQGALQDALQAQLGMRAAGTKARAMENEAKEYEAAAPLRESKRHLEEAETAVNTFKTNPWDPNAHKYLETTYNNSGMFEPGYKVKMTPNAQAGTFDLDFYQEEDAFDDAGNPVGKVAKPVGRKSMTPQQIYDLSSGAVKTEKEKLDAEERRAKMKYMQQHGGYFEAQAAAAGRPDAATTPHFAPYGVDEETGETLTFDTKSGRMGMRLPGRKPVKTDQYSEGHYEDEEGAVIPTTKALDMYQRHTSDAEKNFEAPRSKKEYFAGLGLKFVPKGGKSAGGGGGSGTGGGGPAPQAKPLDRETATSLLQEAGGDRGKARELAKSRGYTF